MVPVARALAVEHLEVSALEPAELAGLIVLSPDRVVFRHPLVASAVYHLAAAPDVRWDHAALAAATGAAGRHPRAGPRRAPPLDPGGSRRLAAEGRDRARPPLPRPGRTAPGDRRRG